MVTMMVWQHGDDDDYHDDHDHDPHVKEFRQQVAESSRKMQELRAQIQVSSSLVLTNNSYQGKIENQSFNTISEAFDR